MPPLRDACATHPLGMPKGLANGRLCSVKQSPSHNPLNMPI